MFDLVFHDNLLSWILNGLQGLLEIICLSRDFSLPCFSNCRQLTGYKILNIFRQEATSNIRSLHFSAMKGAAPAFRLWYVATVSYNENAVSPCYTLLSCTLGSTECEVNQRLPQHPLRLLKHFNILSCSTS